MNPLSDYEFNTQKFYDIVASGLSGLGDNANSLISSFVQGGTGSIAFTFSIYVLTFVIAWNLVMMIIGENGNQTMAKILKAIFVWCLVAPAIIYWVNPVQRENQGAFSVVCSVYSIQSAVMGPIAKVGADSINGDQSNLSKSDATTSSKVTDKTASSCGTAGSTGIVGSIVKSYVVTAATVFDAAYPSEDGFFARAFGFEVNGVKWFLKIVSGGTAFEDTANPVTYALFRILTWIICFVAALYIIYTMVKFIFVVLMGSIYTTVALTLGPMLIPFSMTKKFEFFFKGFVSLLVSGALYSIIAVLFATLTLPLLNSLVGEVHAEKTLNSDVFMGCLVILVFCMLMNMMMAKADNVASVIAGGGPNIGSDMGQGLISKTSNTVVNGAKQVASAALAKATGGASKVVEGAAKAGSSAGGSQGGASGIVGSAAKGAAFSAGSGGMSAGMSSLRSKISQARNKSGR